MANLTFVNNDFAQSGSICALASYGTVIEYFSQKRIHTEQVLSNYFEKNDLFERTSGVFYFVIKHTLISEHFDEYCKPKDLRGFDYIKQIHENNELGTRDYCRILDIKASDGLIVEEDLFRIRDVLRSQDALVMILYKSAELIQQDKTIEYYHAITIGYDITQKKYFYKDPLIPRYQIDDIMFQKAIYEYIVYAEGVGFPEVGPNKIRV